MDGKSNAAAFHALRLECLDKHIPVKEQVQNNVGSVFKIKPAHTYLHICAHTHANMVAHACLHISGLEIKGWLSRENLRGTG